MECSSTQVQSRASRQHAQVIARTLLAQSQSTNSTVAAFFQQPVLAAPRRRPSSHTACIACLPACCLPPACLLVCPTHMKKKTFCAAGQCDRILTPPPPTHTSIYPGVIWVWASGRQIPTRAPGPRSREAGRQGERQGERRGERQGQRERKRLSDPAPGQRTRTAPGPNTIPRDHSGSGELSREPAALPPGARPSERRKRLLAASADPSHMLGRADPDVRTREGRAITNTTHRVDKRSGGRCRRPLSRDSIPPSLSSSSSSSSSAAFRMRGPCAERKKKKRRGGRILFSLLGVFLLLMIAAHQTRQRRQYRRTTGKPIYPAARQRGRRAS